VGSAAAKDRPRTGQAQAQIAAARAAVAQAGRPRHTPSRKPTGQRSRLAISPAPPARTAVSNAAAANAAVEAARAGRRGRGRARASARVLSAQAARDRSELDVSYTRIAPSDGVVSRKTVEVGQYVQPARRCSTSCRSTKCGWWRTGRDRHPRREPGRQGRDRGRRYPGRKFSGHVSSLSPATGARFSLLPPDNATGNFTKVVQRIPVRIDVDGRTDPAHPLRPGMSVTATVVTK
jgi:membrane fusion protein (multidrug efflux system)